MMEIKKKIWPEYFELVKEGKKKFELRLADFDVKEGDVLILEEYDPEKKEYTGRKTEKKVKGVVHKDITKMYPISDIEEHGLNIIELE